MLAVRDLSFLPIDLVQFGRKDERVALLASEARLDRPILAGYERLDLALAVDDQLDRDRLDPAGRKAAADLGPEQRRDLVSHQTVQDAARLLRVDAVHIDLVRMLDRVERRRLRDLVQLDAFGRLQLQEFREMPSDCFALAIGVGREVDVAGARGFHGRLELLDDVPLTFNSEVARGEVVRDVDAERTLGEIADVTDRRLHVKARGQELLDRARLRRRFHDDQRPIGGLFR